MDGQRPVIGDVVPAKRAMRAAMRAARREIADASARSARIWAIVQSDPAVRAARTIMAYASIPGEPDTAAFIAWCRARGTRVLLPDPNRDASPPTEPSVIDVVVVPGLAFTADGRRLGQGGGWYDRVLAQLRADATLIGVCFVEQLVEDLPVEAHDVVLDRVVTDASPIG